MEFKNENVKMSKVNAKLKLMENWKNPWKKSWNLKNVKDYEPLITSSVSAFFRNLYFSDYLAKKTKQLSWR